MRLYKQKDIPKQHRNPSDGPPRATSASPDARFPHRLKRAAEAVSKQIAGHKAMISQFKESKPPLPPVVNNPLPLKRSNAVKGSVKPPVVPLKAIPKVLASVTGSKKHVAPPSTSPKSRSPPAPPGLGAKKSTPPRAKNVVPTTLAAPRKPQSLSPQTRSLNKKAATKSSAPPAKRSTTPANLASVTLTSIPEQDEVDEPLLAASCFRPLAEYPESDDDDLGDDDDDDNWLTNSVEPTSEFDTQITQVFSLGLVAQSKADVVHYGEVAPPLVTPEATLTQISEPMSALVEYWHKPETNFASNSDGFETIPLHLTECVANDTPNTVPFPSVQPTSSLCSVSPIVSSDLVIQQSLSYQPPSSTDCGSVSPIVSSELPKSPSLPCQPPSSTDYEFVSYLGNGAFGAVLFAIHKKNRRDCAIKIISKAIAEERDIVHAVLAEQRVMRQASDHPYLLGLLASFHDSDNFYLISEYCISSLFEIQMLEADKKLASAELACAIDHLHSLGIIHRDIKLENVMIKNDGHIVLGDFGLACSLETIMFPESHLSGSLGADSSDIFEPVSRDICGTLPYMAPEVLCGMEYSYSVDWFSYGVFLHVFYLNKFPWLGSHENPTSYLKAMMSTFSLGIIFQNRSLGDLLKKLFCPNQDARADFSVVKGATFFADIDWQDVTSVASSLSHPSRKPAPGACDALGDKLPPSTQDGARYSIDPDPYPNFTWVNPSMAVGESIPDGSDAHSSSDPGTAEPYTPSYFAASSSNFSFLSFGNPQFISTSPPSIYSRQLPRGSATEGCTTDVPRDSVRSQNEGEEDPIFPPGLIAAFEDSAIYLDERVAEITQTIPEDDEALVRTTIKSLDAGEEPVFDLPSGWKDAFSPSHSPESQVAPPSSSRPDAAEKSSVLPRLKSLWKRAASKFAPRQV
ncbi:kinase-like domain-containing protein [Lactarius hatsudake]|nr:kinase-like domain-containing protein [Lactarius hatsudake]